MPKAQLWVALALVSAVVVALVLLVPRCGEERGAKGPLAAAESSEPAPGAAPSSSAAPWTPRRIAKVDMHTHIDPEIAEPARKFLESQGIGRAINLSGGTPGEGLEDTIAMATLTSGYYVAFVNINFEGIGEPGWGKREVAQLERAKKMGARGVKIAKNLGLRVQFPDGRRVPVDDPVLDPIFDTMAKLNMPLAIHTGDPKAFFDPMGPTNERMDELASHPMWSFADRSLYPTWEGL